VIHIYILLLFSHEVTSNSFVTPWTVAHQAPLSMGFPRQEHWSGLPFPSSTDLPNPRIELVSLVLAGGFFTNEPPGKPIYIFFSKFFSFISYYRMLSIFPVLYSGSLVIIYFVYSSVYMLIPNSSFTFPPSFSFGNCKFVFYVCGSTSVCK